jgi:hypothetical protein
LHSAAVFWVLSRVVPPTPGLILYYFFRVSKFAYSAFLISVFQCLLEAIPHENRTLSYHLQYVILLSNTIMPYLGVSVYEGSRRIKKCDDPVNAIIGAVRIIATLAALFRWYRLRGKEVSPAGDEDADS